MTAHPASRRPSPALPRLLVIAALAAGPHALSAQGVAPALAGSAAGAVVGSAVTAAIVVTRAHLSDDYLWSSRDMFGWPLVPIVAGAASGAVLGSTDSEALREAALVGALTGALGAGVGALAGRALMDDARGPWAGGLVGVGVGALTGWVVGAIYAGDDTVARPATSWIVRIPLGGGR